MSAVGTEPSRGAFREAIAQRSRRVSKLGQMLVKQGRISQAVLDRALVAQADTGRRLGEVLIDMGAVTAGQIRRAIFRQRVAKAAAFAMAVMVGLSALMPNPARAGSGSSSMSVQVSGYVPVKCDFDVAHLQGPGDAPDGFTRIASIQQKCNIDHQLVLDFDASALPQHASVVFEYAGKPVAADPSGHVNLGETQAFFEGRRDLSVRAEGLSNEQLLRLVQTIQVNIQFL